MRVVIDSGERTKKLLLTCDCGCGTQFRRYKNKVNSKNFLNASHRGAAEQRECTEAMCGPYLHLFEEYFESAAPRLYRDLASARSALRPFLLFLHSHDIPFQDVDSTTITRFQNWAIANGYRKAGKDPSAVRTFLEWAILEGHYCGGNPVIPALHGKRPKARTGRPYSTEEMSQIRKLLEERGNERLCAFFEIAAESGMRASEICRLRLQDLHFESTALFVGLPNKTQTERNAFFHSRATQTLRSWLRVRRSDCGHDFIFHNYLGQPLQYDSIRTEFNRTLCIKARGKIVNETGLYSFSIHRLRHTVASMLASNGADASTLMQCLGWASQTSIEGYTKIDEDAKKRSYVQTMSAIEQSYDQDQTYILSPDEFLLGVGV